MNVEMRPATSQVAEKEVHNVVLEVTHTANFFLARGF